ncbi:MAG TPA: hypothetical protein ENG95_00995 [Nitrospirae bacterium]|nr:hypothetical protein BMS3Abin10_00153 [bacterium BMS3Abin10]GBE39338.1 hypothetical protein BMS3Bbin08_01960 [bacterium BMS3Bbin08]HDH51683.1 hypothetical protein [Nitrospirota bacterium]HDK17348.1 hypothetical protein [Nitrospirota bacterium]HDO25204.1 hypothetical protein [Nitrospirota bacterium]
MPFSFLDIEARKSRRIVLLFITLLGFYFLSAFIIYNVVRIGFIFQSGFRTSTSNAYALPVMLKIFGIALLVAVLHWMYSSINMVPRLLSVIGAKPIDPKDRYHFLFNNIVDEVSVAAGGMRIEPYVVPSRYCNAFALLDYKGNAVIGVTEGLLIKTNRRQLEAVVAHEASHLIWGDCLLATVSCSIAAVYAGLLKVATSGWYGGSGSLYRRRGGIYPLMAMLVIVLFTMRVLTRLMNTWISRERELRADATAVRLTRNPLGLAEALYVISTGWRGNRLPAEELGQIFIMNPRSSKLEESWGFFAGLFTTHPPIRKRIDILLDMGHADYKTLESSVKQKERKYDETTVSTSENSSIWYAQNEEKWHGPYTLFELSQLKWLDPFTWITMENDERVKPAHEYKEINKMLKKGLSVDYRVQACPSCSQGLERIYHEGVPIWRCGSCKGRLVRREHLQRIIVREEMAFSPRTKELAGQIMEYSIKNKGKYIKKSESTLKCPACGNIMNRKLYDAVMPYRVEIDLCRLCGLIWFDRDELEVIEYLTEGSALDY